METQKHKSSFYISIISLNASLGSFFFGYMLVVFNPTQECIEIVNNWGDKKDVYDGLVTGFIKNLFKI